MNATHLTGLEALRAATALLQRMRRSHPTFGLLEAADLQWWWRTPRRTDTVPQLVWFDDHGRPAAAVIATAWGDAVALDPIVLPDASPQRLAHVVGRAMAHARACGFEAVEVIADPDDATMRAVLAGHGFVGPGADAGAPPSSLAVAMGWLAAGARPPTGPLPPGYRLCSRAETMHRPHHLAGRSGPAVEARLRETSLYRPDLDLLVLDRQDAVAAYALFWLDPETATGLVEPMRTEAGHQRRGIARHLLAAGIERLAAAGAQRIKICWSPGNPAARDLYRGAGFVPDKQTVVYRRPAGAP